MKSDSRELRLERMKKWVVAPRSGPQREIRATVLFAVLNLYPEMFDPGRDLGEFNDEKGKIVAALSERCSGDDAGSGKAAPDLNLHVKALASLIENGNRSEWWRITLPPYDVNIVVDAPCIMPDSMKQKAWIDGLRKALRSRLYAVMSDELSLDDTAVAQAALLSGVVNAGFGTRAKILAFLHADFSKLECDGRQAFLHATMRPAWFLDPRAARSLREQERIVYQAFFDPDTVLWIRLLAGRSHHRLVDVLKTGDILSSKKLWEPLVAAIQACAPAAKTARSLGALFEACVSWAAITGCGLFAHTAASDVVSPSLSAFAFERMRCPRTGNVGRVAAGASRVRAAMGSVRRRDRKSHASVESPLKALKVFLAREAREGRNDPSELLADFAKFVADHALTKGSIEDAILGFLVDRVEFPLTGSAPRAVSLGRYVDAFGQELIDVFGPVVVETLSIETRIANYLEMFDSTVSLADRQYLAKRLGEFDGYLVKKFQLDPVPFWFFDADDVLVRHGQGNLLSPAEYAEVLDSLQPAPDSPDWRASRIATIALILGFRCGLRIGEVRRLRLCDVRLSVTSILEVQDSEYGQTKSAFAPRRMRLDVYLTAYELGILSEWHALRAQESGGNGRELLLALDPGDRRPIPNNRLREPVQDAMRQVTGDQSLTFRHLRHSFATWTLFKLQRDLDIHISAYGIAVLEHQEFGENACRRLREHLSPETRDASSRQHPVRNAAYLVAAQLGHLSPQTSLANYIHLLDLARITQVNLGLSYSLEEVQFFSGIRKAQAYRSFDVKAGRVSGLDLLSRLLIKRELDNEIVAPDAPAQNVNTYPSIPEADEILGLVTILRRGVKSGEWRSADDLARLSHMHQIDQRKLASCLSACEVVRLRYRTRKTKNPKTGAERHPLVPWVPGPGNEDRELRRYLEQLIITADEASRAERRWGLDLFLSRTIHRVERRPVGNETELDHFSRSVVRFAMEDKDAARYVSFLKGLGIAPERVRVDLIPSEDHDTDLAERTECARILGLPVASVVQGRRRDPRNVNVYLRLAVSVESEGFVAGRSRRHHEPIRTPRRASRTFQSAMHIAAIFWAMRT